VRILASNLLLVAVLGILSRCKSLRNLERFAICHHALLIDGLGHDLQRDCLLIWPFRDFF